MINAYHLVNALPAALFGIFALWAAASRRHWFVRTAVVAAAILVALLIPAFEVVFEFSIECALVIAAVSIWRRRRQSKSIASSESSSRFRPRLSLETLMLAVVVVSVVTAVIARAPRLPADQWYQFSINGIVAAAVCLTCVWIVFGKAPAQIRLAAFPLLALLLGALHHTLLWTGWVVKNCLIYQTASLETYLRTALRDTWGGIGYWATVVGLGMLLLCIWLVLVRVARWFDPFSEQDYGPMVDREWRRVVIARSATVAIFLAVAAFPLALLYRLLTPTPLPHVELPNPNGFDDLIAAGKMIDPDDAKALQTWDQLSTTQLRAAVAKQQPALDRVHEGLQKVCWNPYVFRNWPREDVWAMQHVDAALRAQSALARNSEDRDLEVQRWLDVLKIVHAELRGSAAGGHPYYYPITLEAESDICAYIWRVRSELSADQCHYLSKELSRLDSKREPWEPRVARRRIIEENAGWQRHLKVILADWSRKDIATPYRAEEFWGLAQLRVLLTELAIRAFQAENHRLPERLSDLVPNYLDAVPADPHGNGNGEIKYRITGDQYVLYSIGPDGEDDGGARLIGPDGKPEGDLTTDDLFPAVQSSPPPTAAWSGQQ